MSNGNGGGGGFDFGGWFSGLLDTLVAVIEAIVNFLNALVQAIVGALNFLFAGEQNIFGFAFAGDKILWAWLKKIWDAIYHGVIVKALSHLLHLIQTIQKWAKKLKSWLDRYHALQRKYQVQAFRRVINLIQRARKILLLFRLFHVKFATKLDNWLAGIEGSLIRRQMFMERKTNEIIGWINFIADPTKLFRLSPLAQSIYRYLRGLRGALGIPESRALTGSEQTRQSQDRALVMSTPHLDDPAVQRILVGLDAEAKNYRV